MPKRIAILADAHVGLEGLQPDGRTYGDAGPLLERAVGSLLDEFPEQTFFVGDIVNRGFDHEYERAKRILQPVQRVLEPVVGNHELQRAGVGEFEGAWGVRAVRETLFSDFPTIVLNSGIEGLADGQWHGVLNDLQLSFLDRFLARSRDVPAMVFCHHPVAGTVRGSEKPMGGLDNSAEVRRLLERHAGRRGANRVVFVSGHAHEQDVVIEGNVTYLGCPPLAFWPHAFFVADVGTSSVEVRTVQVEPSPEASPDPLAADAAHRERCGNAPSAVTIEW